MPKRNIEKEECQKGGVLKRTRNERRRKVKKRWQGRQTDRSRRQSGKERQKIVVREREHAIVRKGSWKGDEGKTGWQRG